MSVGQYFLVFGSEEPIDLPTLEEQRTLLTLNLEGCADDNGEGGREEENRRKERVLRVGCKLARGVGGVTTIALGALSACSLL